MKPVASLTNTTSQTQIHVQYHHHRQSRTRHRTEPLSRRGPGPRSDGRVLRGERLHAGEHGAADLEREKAFLASVAEWRNYEVIAAAANDYITFTETVMEFVTNDGSEVRMEQVTRARWQDGRIVDERFYHS